MGYGRAGLSGSLRENRVGDKRSAIAKAPARVLGLEGKWSWFGELRGFPVWVIDAALF